MLLYPFYRWESWQLSNFPELHIAEPGLIPMVIWTPAYATLLYKSSVLISLEKPLSSYKHLNIKESTGFLYKQNLN